MKRSLKLFNALLFATAVNAAGPANHSSDCKTTANLSVQCTRASSMIQVHVGNCKRIGRVVLEVKDAHGRVLYHEEGKASTGELVRRLDKHVFPRGTHTVSVTARDFIVAQTIIIE